MDSVELSVPSGKTTASSIRGIAPAIALVGGDQFHLGCYYEEPEEEAGTVFLLHFRKDEWIERIDPMQEFVWATTKLSYRDMQALANSCSAIYKRYREKGPHFALNYLTQFSSDYSLTLQGTEGGFTCATFVMAIFETANIKLLATDTWPRRESDKAWQERVRDYYAQRSETDDAVKAQIAQDVGCVRFRPQEVLAAATLARHPAPFKKVKVLGEFVAAKVKALGRCLKL